MTTTSIPGATRHRSTFAILATGVGAFAVLQSVVNPLLPVIQRELGATHSTVTWMVTG